MTRTDRIGFYLDRLNRRLAARWWGPYSLVILAEQLFGGLIPSIIHIPLAIGLVVALLWFDPSCSWFGRHNRRTCDARP